MVFGGFSNPELEGQFQHEAARTLAHQDTRNSLVLAVAWTGFALLHSNRCAPSPPMGFDAGAFRLTQPRRAALWEARLHKLLAPHDCSLSAGTSWQDTIGATACPDPATGCPCRVVPITVALFLLLPWALFRFRRHLYVSQRREWVTGVPALIWLHTCVRFSGSWTYLSSSPCQRDKCTL